MNEKMELIPADPEHKAVMRADRPVESIGGMLQALVEKGVKKDDVAALEKLTDLYVKMQDREAQKDFVTALMDFQSEAKQIKAERVVMNKAEKGGGVRYRFADYEEIMNEVQPMAQRHGFVISFSSEIEEGRITKICKLQHKSGHSTENRYTVRIGSGPPGASETQSDGAAHTYAKRGALCDALNIRIDKNFDDARALGGKITAEQAAELKRRVEATGSDQKAFLKFAKADAYENIPEAMYQALDQNLRRKEKP